MEMILAKKHRKWYKNLGTDNAQFTANIDVKSARLAQRSALLGAASYSPTL